MKQAMLDVQDGLDSSDLSTRMLLQVHDELVLEAPDREVEPTIQLVQKIMEAAYSLDIPLTTEASYGKNWGSLTKMEKKPQNLKGTW
jgi:DNA polymerase-1